jgi:uncharacterized protein
MLRVFIGEDAKFRHQPLYQAIVLKARKDHHLAGATVLRGLMGFGHSSRLRNWRSLRLCEDLPLVIEIVDTEEKIKAFLATLDAMMPSGPIALEKVQFLRYGLDRKHGLRAAKVVARVARSSSPSRH